LAATQIANGQAGEEELFKARARENGEVKIIDLITARLDAKTDSFIATHAQPASDRCPH
jgi:predicted ATP-dependent Lon-type protease